jgi:hypothetical protein
MEKELFAYPFVGGYDIENAIKALGFCRGAGTALDDKHSSKEENQVL